MNFSMCTLIFFKKFVPLVYAIIGFGLLITIHEFGHFLFCKVFSVHTPTFSIGMGPTVYKRTIGKTNFRLALIPIGGYVEIAGMSEVGQGEQKDAKASGPESFATKPYWQKFLILMGGVLFNLMFAYIVFSSLYFIGMPVQKEVSLVIRTVGKTKESGLQKGDKLVSINDTTLHADPKTLFPSLRKIAGELLENKEKPIRLQVQRGEETEEVTLPGVADGTNLQRLMLGGATLDIKSERVEYESYPLFQSIQKGVSKTNLWIGNVFASLKILITKRNIKDFGGPIMIVTQSFKMAQRGLLALFIFLAIISINLAVINILPIGALDGGQLLFETVEFIIRRRIPDVIRLAINLASWFLILGLILYLSYQDILSLFMRRGS